MRKQTVPWQDFYTNLLQILLRINRKRILSTNSILFDFPSKTALSRFIFIYVYMMKALWRQHLDKFTFPDNISCKKEERMPSNLCLDERGQKNLTVYLPKWTPHLGRHNYTILYCKLNILLLKARIETCLMEN